MRFACARWSNMLLQMCLSLQTRQLSIDPLREPWPLRYSGALNNSFSFVLPVLNLFFLFEKRSVYILCVFTFFFSFFKRIFFFFFFLVILPYPLLVLLRVTHTCFPFFFVCVCASVDVAVVEVKCWPFYPDAWVDAPRTFFFFFMCPSVAFKHATYYTYISCCRRKEKKRKRTQYVIVQIYSAAALLCFLHKTDQPLCGDSHTESDWGSRSYAARLAAAMIGSVPTSPLLCVRVECREHYAGHHQRDAFCNERPLFVRVYLCVYMCLCVLGNVPPSFSTLYIMFHFSSCFYAQMPFRRSSSFLFLSFLSLALTIPTHLRSSNLSSACKEDCGLSADLQNSSHPLNQTNK